MGRLAMAVQCLALLGVAGFALDRVIDGSPALDRSVRAEGVLGDWRVSQAPAHFDLAEYYKQLGEGYLMADMTLGDGGDQDGAALAVARAGIAEDLLDRSLRLSPADGFAWASLAWAKAIQGHTGEARAAMEVSWALAPRNAPLAPGRLAFAEFLAEAGVAPEPGRLTETERAGIARDVATLRRFRPGLATTILAASPAISEVQSAEPDQTAD